MSIPPSATGNGLPGYGIPTQAAQPVYAQNLYMQPSLQQPYFDMASSNAQQQSYYVTYPVNTQQPQQQQPQHQQQPQPQPQQQQQQQQQYYQPSPPQPQHQASPIPQRQTQQLTGWSALFFPDGSQGPLFQALMAAFFSKLDHQGTGTIAPEALSAFLDLQGFSLDANVWKANYKTTNAMFLPVDLADFELKAACEAWAFDHVAVIRNPGRPQLPYGGMPLLTLRGFTDMMAVEHAAYPDRAWRALNTALLYYGIWAELGPLPRQALLPAMPPQVQARITQAGMRSRQAAQQKINANAAKNALMLQGQQNSLDLIGDVRYVYY